jgi:MFS family permease
MYNIAPLFGPAFGAVLGGLVSQYVGWKWNFYITSIASAGLLLLDIFVMSETYAPRILEVRMRKIMQSTGRTDLRTPYAESRLPLRKLLPTAFARPLKMLAQEPITQILTIYLALLYGTMYILYSTYASLWTTRYHQSQAASGYNYLALGAGYFVGSICCTFAVDRIYKRLTLANNGTSKPEYKIPMMIPASIMTPIGLFIYGWSAEAYVHWALPAFGAALFAAGAMIAFQCVSGYTVECFSRYSASASSANLILRSFAGFAFPLFGPAMYSKMGYGWANSLLGLLTILLGVPAPILLWKWGEKLRQRSNFLGVLD